MGIAYSAIAETNSGTGEAGSDVVAIPSHSSGDSLVLVVNATSAGDSPALAIDTPSGWTAGPTAEGGNASAVRIATFVKDGNGSESTVTVEVASGDCTFQSFCLVYTGGMTAASLTDVSSSGSQESGDTETSEAVTTTVANTAVIYGCVFDDDVGTEADKDSDGGFSGTMRGYIQIGGNGHNGLNCAVSTHTQASIGATDACVWDNSGDSDGAAWVTLALKPSVGPAVTVVGGDDEIWDGEQNVVLTGTAFGGTTGKVYLSETMTLGAVGTYTELHVDSWADTSIQVDIAEITTLNPVSDDVPLFSTAFNIVEDSGAARSAGFSVLFTTEPHAAVNANASLEVDVEYIVANRVQVTVAPGGTSHRWAFNHDSGGDTALTATSSEVKAFAGKLVDGEDAAEVLTGSGAYIPDNNAITEDGTFTLPSAPAAGESFVSVLSFKLDGANVANAETGTIRMEEGDGTDYDTYTQTLTYTAVKSGQTVVLGQATETDLAQPLSWAPKARLIGQATETDLAQAIATIAKAKIIGQATEVDLAQAVSPAKSRAVGQSSEADAAQPVSTSKALATGQALETDVAQTATAAKTRAIGQSAETDLAHPLSLSKTIAISQANETDQAFTLGLLVEGGDDGWWLEIDATRVRGHNQNRPDDY